MGRAAVPWGQTPWGQSLLLLLFTLWPGLSYLISSWSHYCICNVENGNGYCEVHSED